MEGITGPKKMNTRAKTHGREVNDRADSSHKIAMDKNAKVGVRYPKTRRNMKSGLLRK